MDMVALLESLTQVKGIPLIIALLALNVIASTTDFSFGWINARFNKNVQFESGKALYGIIKKMMYFIVLVLFMIITFLLIPEKIAIPAVITLYIGFLVSEVNSILSHLELTDDGKKGELFKTFISRLIKGDKYD